MKAKAPGAHEICPQHGYKTEKQENIDVSLCPVTIRIMAQSVLHCACYCRGTKHKHHDWRKVQKGTKGPPRHSRSKENAKADKYPYQHLHLLNCHSAAVKPVFWSLTVCSVRATEHVSKFIGEVGEYLKAHCSEHNEDGHIDVYLPVGHGQENAKEHPRHR